MSVLRNALTAWILAGALALGLVVALAGGFAAKAPAAGETYESRAAALAATQAPRLKLEIQYPGPLRDTVVQRWRDPVDGTVCYIYLPIAVPHSAGPPGLVQYGQADIGTMSCLPGPRS